MSPIPVRSFRLPSLLAVAALLCLGADGLQGQHPWSGLPPEVQIRLAVQAAPEEMREDATVQGYDASGRLGLLREGSNELVCLAPNPASAQFEVSCHHKGLEPFIARGRELLAQGITGQERVATRLREYEEGKLPIPYGSVNYILTGSGFDPASGAITDAYLRWTIYTPGATPESTGITARPSQGGPWLMAPGTPGAHVMITPPRPRPAGGG
jgi:hypothetical protein